MFSLAPLKFLKSEQSNFLFLFYSAIFFLKRPCSLKLSLLKALSVSGKQRKKSEKFSFVFPISDELNTHEVIKNRREGIVIFLNIH